MIEKLQAKSFTVNGTAGASVLTNVSLNGQSGYIMGLAVVGSLATTSLDFTVDNTVYLDTVPAIMFEKGIDNPKAFTDLPIPIKGSSSIKFVSRSTVIDVFTITIWYKSA